MYSDQSHTVCPTAMGQNLCLAETRRVLERISWDPEGIPMRWLNVALFTVLLTPMVLRNLCKVGEDEKDYVNEIFAEKRHCKKLMAQSH